MTYRCVGSKENEEKHMKNGAKQKINTFFHSISTKIMLVILILVLPLNITAIILSNVTMENMIDQAKNSVQNVMEGYLTDIQNRMSNAQYFIYNIRMEDPDALKMLQAEDSYSYEMS